MKNIRQILAATSAAVVLVATSQVFGESPRQTRDPVLVAPDSQPECVDLSTTVADIPGTPRMKADPSLAAIPTTCGPKIDITAEIEAMPGSPRQKPDPSVVAAQTVPGPQDETLSMR
ncbi:MAG TPA: hypothetical protein VH595_05935 [Verrucomicrobiae bacterium]|nr:hypothetical protein [Verrucomicrobiae bacterium]